MAFLEHTQNEDEGKKGFQHKSFIYLSLYTRKEEEKKQPIYSAKKKCLQKERKKLFVAKKQASKSQTEQETPNTKIKLGVK